MYPKKKRFWKYALETNQVFGNSDRPPATNMEGAVIFEPFHPYDLCNGNEFNLVLGGEYQPCGGRTGVIIPGKHRNSRDVTGNQVAYGSEQTWIGVVYYKGWHIGSLP
jgi:hypothetical protein